MNTTQFVVSPEFFETTRTNQQAGRGRREGFCALLLLKFLLVIAKGKMPPLEKVFAAVEQTRKKYRHRILDARKPVRRRVLSFVVRCGTKSKRPSYS